MTNTTRPTSAIDDAIGALRKISESPRDQHSHFAPHLQAIASMLAQHEVTTNSESASVLRKRVLEEVTGQTPFCQITISCDQCSACTEGTGCANMRLLTVPVILMARWCGPILRDADPLRDIYGAVSGNYPWDLTCDGEMMTFKEIIDAMRNYQCDKTVPPQMTASERQCFERHFAQTLATDIEMAPIIMYEDMQGYHHIGDGYHRLCKAILEEQPTLGVYVLTWNEICRSDLATVDWFYLCDAVTSPYTAWVRV